MMCTWSGKEFCEKCLPHAFGGSCERVCRNSWPPVGLPFNVASGAVTKGRSSAMSEDVQERGFGGSDTFRISAGVPAGGTQHHMTQIKVSRLIFRHMKVSFT